MAEPADFKDQRVMIVGGKAHNVQVLRAVFGMVGIGHIASVAELRRAIEMLRAERYSAIFCDAQADPVGEMEFPLAARRMPGVLNPMVPIFLVCSAARRRQIELARDTGVTDVLARPISAATIVRKMKIALANPRPFIAAPDFFGPDRRAKVRLPWRGDERRTRTAKKVKVTLAEAPKTDSDITLI